MKFHVIITPSGNGGFDVCVPALEGCYTHGNTKEEALENTKMAIVRYLEGLDKINRVLIKGGGTFEEIEITAK
jgi:predicted RNase H-like HicB family nuclease